MGVKIHLFVGNNFKVEEFKEVSLDVLENPDVLYDDRNQILSESTILSDWNWYYNYLDFVQILANRNPKSRVTWLLDLGYVPIVYLPTCKSSKAAELFRILDDEHIPYVKVQPYSFIKKYVDTMNMDGWVSKMDISRLTGWEPKKITSKKVLKELIKL